MFFFVSLILILCSLSSMEAVTLVADFSQRGFKGNLEIDQSSPNEAVSIRFFLNGKASAESVGWKVLNAPRDMSLPRECSDINPDVFVDFEDFFGKITIPGEKTLSIASKVDWRFNLFGNDTFWGKSVVIGRDICSNFKVKGEEDVRLASARFLSPVAGIIWFRSIVIGNNTHSLVYTDLYDNANDPPQSSDHTWQLYVTDVLDKKTQSLAQCDHLQTPIGRELSEDIGKVRVSDVPEPFSRRQSVLPQDFEFPELSGARDVYVVIKDANHPDSFYACAKLNREFPRVGEVNFSSKGVIGTATMTQRDPFASTQVKFDLEGLNNNSGGYHIHDYPLQLSESCGATGGHYNPTGVTINTSLGAGVGSHDQYELGDLSGKHGLYRGLTYVRGSTWDHHLPLWGPHSVIGRSIVIHEDASGKRWVCGNIGTKSAVFVVATATFRYPLVGRIWFFQRAGLPLSETHVFIERLLYSDGSKETTKDHPWGIFTKTPGKDYYDWQNRCKSAGDILNPFKRNQDLYRGCDATSPLRCALGDLSFRHGTLTVTYAKSALAMTRKFFTDMALPLQGPESIIGKSVVIQDFKGPEARGDRLACTPIIAWHRHKAVASEWFANEGEVSLKGEINFYQFLPYTATLIEADISGLRQQAGGYHVHVAPVVREAQFPCEASQVYGHYNPTNVDYSKSPPPGKGSLDQYEAGDLSGKFLPLNGKSDLRFRANDSSLFLFAPHSIVGRSVVVHKAADGSRWACATIGWGFAPKEARQYSAIASFHHPEGFVTGYVRFRQVVYTDGSRTETSLEVSLKDAEGGLRRNVVTEGHRWEVFVNPSGHDQVVKNQVSRCQSAGYRWDPYFIQLADEKNQELYDEECGEDNPLRCDAGDLTGKLGSISLGSNRRLFSDANLPLGPPMDPESAVGRSLVIFAKDASHDRFSCANIEPDDDLLQWVTVEASSGFSPSVFIETVREYLGAPAWFVETELTKAHPLHPGNCYQMPLHFMGPLARELQKDFNSLMAAGSIAKPTVTFHGYTAKAKADRFPFKTCGKDDSSSSEDSSGIFGIGGGSSGLSPSLPCLLIVIFLCGKLPVVFR